MKVCHSYNKDCAECKQQKIENLEAENEALKAELAAIKKNIKDKYRNANEALGLNLGEIDEY